MMLAKFVLIVVGYYSGPYAVVAQFHTAEACEAALDRIGQKLSIIHGQCHRTGL